MSLPRYKIAILILGTCFLSFLFGCSTISIDTGSSKMQTAPLFVAQSLRFEDIPVPAGFNLIINESFVFQNEQLRVGLLKYEGDAAPEQVLRFYKDQMPLYRWNLINIVEHEVRTLSFEKEAQSCTVTIDGSKSKTILIVATSPKSR